MQLNTPFILNDIITKAFLFTASEFGQDRSVEQHRNAETGNNLSSSLYDICGQEVKKSVCRKREFKCDFCLKLFPKKLSLTLHKQSAHRRVMISELQARSKVRNSDCSSDVSPGEVEDRHQPDIV